MTVEEVLRTARALIDTPEKLARGYYAKDADGNLVDFESGAATCFCTLGALSRACGDSRHNDVYTEAADAIAIAAGCGPVVDGCLGRNSDGLTITQLSDRSDHPTVMSWFDRALARAS